VFCFVRHAFDLPQTRPARNVALANARALDQELWMQIRPFALADEADVIRLWNACGLTRAWNDPHLDIQRKLTVQPELFLVGTIDGQLIASGMAGYDGHRGWIYYLAVEPTQQRRGYAKALVEALSQRLMELGCPKVELMVRSENRAALGFYEALAFKVEQVVVFGRRLIADD
jgi:ribosomal protein S18 acetylase RimI-like enzyme